MALKGFMARGDRDTEAAVQPPTPLRSDAPAPRTVSPSTSVDASTTLEGKLRCKETLRIDGSIKGEVECEKAVLVGEGARVHASIAADEVQVAGGVKGDITARRKITLQKTAVVTGDLTTPGIVIEEGAKVKGRIVIGSETEPANDSKPADDAKKNGASRKVSGAGAKPDEAPAGQPASVSP